MSNGQVKKKTLQRKTLVNMLQ